MKQVVLNLLDNAIKFSSPESTIVVRTSSTRATVELAVRNPGQDLSEDQLERIFERFVQRDGSFKREHGGVGLGLNLVRAIIELHGGKVWCEIPEPGLVEFRLRLPITG
jgi:signal transduction histidine kinase